MPRIAPIAYCCVILFFTLGLSTAITLDDDRFQQLEKTVVRNFVFYIYYFYIICRSFLFIKLSISNRITFLLLEIKNGLEAKVSLLEALLKFKIEQHVRKDSLPSALFLCCLILILIFIFKIGNFVSKS